MKDRKFCCYAPHICSLTKREIERPYLVLAAIFKKRTQEGFQNELWNLQKTIYRDGEWKNYNPAELFIFGNDLIKLTDVLWLVNKYSPGLSSAVVIPTASGPGTELMQTVNALFEVAFPKTAHKAIQPETSETVLSRYFKNHYFGSLKFNIYNYLQVALDASYMRNDKYEYFNMDEEFIPAFSAFSELITEGYKIYEKGTHVFPNLQATKETKLAIDAEHTTFLSYECIVKPHDLAENFFTYYLDILHIKSGLTNWKKLLYERDFWKRENNPGNLIYLQVCLGKLIDVMWLMYQRKYIDEYLSRYRLLQENIGYCTDLSREENANPLQVIQDFYSLKKLHKWKSTLHKWLIYSLSNTDQPTGKQRDKIEPAFRQLLKFIEATYLLICTKSKTEQTALR